MQDTIYVCIKFYFPVATSQVITRHIFEGRPIISSIKIILYKFYNVEKTPMSQKTPLFTLSSLSTLGLASANFNIIQHIMLPYLDIQRYATPGSLIRVIIPNILHKQTHSNITTIDHHFMMTSSSENIFGLLALCVGSSPVTGEIPSQRPVTRSFDVSFDLRPNIWLKKQLWCWWFETPSRSLWRHCNVLANLLHVSSLCLRIAPAAENASLRWRHNGHDSVSNHQPHHCLLNRLFRHRSKKTSKFRVTGLCAGNSPGTGEFPAQRASYAENVSIWWRNDVT